MRTTAHQRIDYQALSLPGLLERIVHHSDQEALSELHQERTVFNHNGSGPLLLVRFVDCLRLDAQPQWNGKAEDAYSLTIDKFSRLSDGEHDVHHRQTGVDSRHYFRPVLDSCSSSVSCGEIDAELRAASLLQGMVKRHFRLSLLECHRNGSKTRYSWRISGKDVQVLMPRHLVGRERRLWLEKHIPDANPQRPGEAQRIQRIVDEQFAGAGPVPFDDAIRHHICGPGTGHSPRPPWANLDRIRVDGLAAAVADEKVGHIDRLRPGIRRLGETRLRSLIHHIFDAVSEDEYREGLIAKQFGLTKPTFSRFAGSQWKRRERNRNHFDIPDLWKNTAFVLASIPEFSDVARAVGVWRSVEAAADCYQSHFEESNHE